MPPVCSGSLMMCTMGAATSSLNVRMPDPAGKLTANILDYLPMQNIPPFGMCRSMVNPSVASATAAARGALQMMPCIPVVPAAWVPGDPMTLVRNAPAVSAGSKLTCVYGGVISIVSPTT